MDTQIKEVQKFPLRLPTYLHEALRVKAFSQRKSLNTLLVEIAEADISISKSVEIERLIEKRRRSAGEVPGER